MQKISDEWFKENKFWYENNESLTTSTKFDLLIEWCLDKVTKINKDSIEFSIITPEILLEGLEQYDKIKHKGYVKVSK